MSRDENRGIIFVMQVRRVLLSLAALSCAVTASAQCAMGKGDSIIAEVVLENPTGVTLDQQASIRVALVGRCFDLASPTELTERVYDQLQRFGHFQANVLDPHIRVINTNVHPSPVSVIFDFQAGPLFRLGDIVISGNRNMSADQLRSVIPISPGDIFDTSHVRDALTGIRNLYLTHGYIHATVTPKTQLDTANHKVRLTLHIIEGEGASN